MQSLIQTLINTGTFIDVNQAMHLFAAAFDLIKKIFCTLKVIFSVILHSQYILLYADIVLNK